MRPTIGALALLSLLGVAPAAARGPTEGITEISAFAGYTFFSDAKDLSFPFHGPYKGAEDAAVYGLRAGYLATDRLAFEVSFAYARSQLVDGPDVRTLNARVEGRWNFLTGPLTPFVAAGPSLFMATTDLPDSDADLGMSAGPGLAWYLGEHLALRFDARWMLNDGFDGALVSDYELVGGLVYLMDAGRE